MREKTKKLGICIAFAFIGMIILVPWVFAYPVSQGDTIRIGYASPDYPRYSNGGPFKITDISNGGVEFVTFCVEGNEYFNTAGTYYIGSITDGAINGGISGGNPDKIDSKTGYLYYNFIMGNYDKGDSDDLQQVIWYIEGEYNGSLTVRASELLKEAQDNSGSGLNGDPLWGVRVLNIYHDTSFTRHAQDQLVLVPEPATLLLLGSGLIGFGILGRKRFRKKN